MKPFYNKALLAAGWLLSAFLLHPSSMRAQGSLTPTGAPASTMKSLSQVEPRTPVDAINTPGQTGVQFLITQPGSYYLTSNINVGDGEDGIYIEANDVTLDLNGFVLAGANSASGILAFDEDIVIRNGAVLGWLNGVTTDDRCELDRLRAYGCGSAGFLVGNDCAVKNCVAITNDYGVVTGNHCEIAESLAVSNSLIGFQGGDDCAVSACRAIGNADEGFFFGDGFNISKCSAMLNGVSMDNGLGFALGSDGFISQCVADTNGDYGLFVATRCTVTECVVNANGGAGIGSNGDSVLTDNQASTNGYAGILVFVGGNGIEHNQANDNGYAGILTYAGGNRIEHNQTRDNQQMGIEATGGAGGDIVVRNVSVNNGVNYNPASGPNIGPVQTPATATSPWANF